MKVSEMSKREFKEAFKEAEITYFSEEGLNHLYDFLIEGFPNEKFNRTKLLNEFTEGKLENVLFDFGLESFEELEENTEILWYDEPNDIVLCVSI